MGGAASTGLPAPDTGDVIRIANESIYGLNGAVFTNDADAAYRVSRRVRTGSVSQKWMGVAV